MKYVVITGVSTGIGYDAARYLTERGWHVLGSVRKQADADRVQAALGDNFTPLLFDVTDGAAVSTAVTQTQSIIGENNLAGLINNAGIATPGPLMYMPMEDFRWQFEVNVFGLLDVTQKFLPLLGARKNCSHPPGRIVNISSLSGIIVYPFQGAYAASKHALEAMSDALRRELLIYDIDVILIEPGTVKTPVIAKFGEQVAKYRQTDYAPALQRVQSEVADRETSGLPVERISEVIYKALESPHPKTRYIIPRKKLMGWLLPRWLPDRIFDRYVGKRLGLGKE